MRGNLEMYSIIMKADLPVPPTEQSNVNILNELHLLPHVAKNKKKIFLEPIYVPKTNLLDSSPSLPAQAGLYYIYPSFWANIKSLHSGLTSRHSTFSDIILTLYQLYFLLEKKRGGGQKNHLGNTFVVKTTSSTECPNSNRSDFSGGFFSK